MSMFVKSCSFLWDQLVCWLSHFASVYFDLFEIASKLVFKLKFSI